MNTAYRELRFSARPEAARYAAAAVLPYVPSGRPAQIVDVGCGTGDTLLAIAQARPLARCVGIDMSEVNLASAAEHVRKAGSGDNFRWVAGDYLSCTLSPADIIFSESVMHLIPADAHIIFRKLKADLGPGGKALLIMPYESIGNRLLIGVRRALRLVRNRAMDAVLLWIARTLYPKWPIEELRERLEYMYVVPLNLDGAEWRGHAKDCGLVLLETVPWKNTSFTKLRHRMLVFERADSAR